MAVTPCRRSSGRRLRTVPQYQTHNAQQKNLEINNTTTLLFSKEKVHENTYRNRQVSGTLGSWA
jgi:hypothetical protein